MTTTDSFPLVKAKRSSAGLGLFAQEEIKKGSKVIEYTGEHIDEAEKDRRGGKYIFSINEEIFIDGKGRENTARYINHACLPNTEAVNYDDEKIIIEALRNIKEGEEITLDYGDEYFDEHIAPVGCKCKSCSAE